MAPHKNQWTALGVVAYEPVLKKINDDLVAAKTVIISENNGEKNQIPVVAYNKKAHVLCALAHKGSTIFAKGVFQTNMQLTSIQAKTLLTINFKIIDFEVMIREPVKISDVDYVDIAAKYDPEFFMEEEDNVE